MLLLFQVLLILVLLGICYQDFAQRLVYGYFYLLHFIFLLVVVYLDKTWSLESFMLNVIFILLQYFLLVLYYSIKHKQLYVLFIKEIGLGDVVFLISISILCPFPNFIYIYLVGALSGLLWYLALNILGKKPENIPLAAFLSIAQISFVLLEWLDCKKNFNLPNIV